MFATVPRLIAFARVVALLSGGVAGPAATPPAIRFEEVAAKSGLRFELRNGASGQFHQIELTAGGVAVLDYNNDGCTDIFFTNGAAIPEPSQDRPGILQPPVSQQLRHDVYRRHRRGRPRGRRLFHRRSPSAISITTASPISSSPA